jgi:hypothetical protein
LFTEVYMEISSLLLPPSLVHFQSSCPLHCVLVFSSLFNCAQGAVLGLSQG